MKATKIIFVFLVSVNAIFAQTVVNINLNNGKPFNVINIAGVANLSSVMDIYTYTGTATTFLISDSIQGGTFNLYGGNDLPDGGMIFQDGSGRKFLRKTTDDKIFIRWYGLLPSTKNTGSDNPIFVNAINYLKSHKQKFGIIQLEPCIFNTWYRLESTLNISGIKIYGAGGQGRQPSSTFVIAPGFIAFDIRTEYTEVKDIAIRHAAGNVLDSFNHTFKIRTVVRFENVNITQNYCGNGYDISGCGPALSSAPDSIFGNPDHSIFINCQASLCLNGAFIKGCDANAMLFQNCNFQQNFIWGVFDNGFLGNTYLTTHWASNSQVNNSGARVGDTTFYPYPDSVYNIVGKYPPDNPTYWYKTNYTGSNQNWNSTRKYFGGGALWANNPNSNHAVISCYTEDFQANSIISPRSVWYEGTAGSPVKGGIWQHTFGGTTFFTGAGIFATNVTTDNLNFNSYPNGALATTTIKKNPASTGSAELILPLVSGKLASSKITESTTYPTVSDITYNESLIWLNTSTNILRMYVNNRGALTFITLP